MPGESYHTFGGGYGGLWRRIGRSSHQLVGIGFSAQGRHLGFPYRFTDAISNPRVAFMAAGKTQVLGPGQLIYLTARETHALRGIEDASLLVTILSGRE